MHANTNQNKRLFAPKPSVSDDVEALSKDLSVGIYRVDREGIVRQVLSITDDANTLSAPGGTVFELVPETHRPELQQSLHRVFAHASPGRFQYTHTATDGRERFHEVRLSPSPRAGANESALIAILDVTDLLEEARQTEVRNAELLSVFETLPDTYFRLGPDGTIHDYRAQKCSDLYLPPERFLGRRIQQFMPEHVVRLWEENLSRLRLGEPEIAYEYTLDLPNGRQAFEARLSALPHSDDIIAVVRNISKRRSAEAELLESNHRLEEAQSIAHLGSWTYDIETNRAIWTPETYRIFGVEPEQFVPSIESVGGYIHPEDRQRYADQVGIWLSGVEAEPIDLRILRPDGTLRIISSRCRPVLDDNGSVVQLAGTVQDITEHRLMELELKSSEERFRHTIELSWDMILLEDIDTRPSYVLKFRSSDLAIKHA